MSMTSAHKSQNETPVQVLSMHPKKFMLWLFIVSIVMIFASLTSAYVVKQSQGVWLIFDLPQAFVYSTLAVFLSSVTMQWGYFAAKKDNLSQIKTATFATLVLSIVFLVLQWIGWSQLVDQQVFWIGNAAGSFIYVLTGLHAFHLVAGIVFLIIVLISTLKFKVHSKSLTLIEMCTTFWHFLSGLWIYLYLFLLLNN